MKKTLVSVGLISILLVIGSTITGCGGGNNPSSVVIKYHTAVEKGNTKAIMGLMDSESAEMAAMFSYALQQMLAEYGSIASTEQTINNGTAVVKVTYKNGQTENYDLVNVDGKWLITMNK